MSDIKFSKREKDVLVQKVKMYFEAELNQEIGGFEAEFLIDFFAKEMGVYFYNKGVLDAQALLSKKIDEITELFYELERPTEFKK